MKIASLVLSSLLLLFVASTANAMAIESITSQDGGDGGLVVLVEPVGPDLAVALAGTDRHLVVALTADAELAEGLDAAFVEAGVHPVADAVRWRQTGALPFPTHAVNVLVLDGAVAERVGDAEVRRVLVPGYGFALVDGEMIRKPRPERMDTWLGWNAGPTGNRMSADTVLQPPNSIRWLTGPRHGGFHLASERVHYLEASWGSRNRYFYEEVFGNTRQHGHARDAFSGVALWRLQYRDQPTLLPWNWIVFSDGQRLFLPADGAGRAARGQPPGHVDMQMRDIRSGRVLAQTLPLARWGDRVRAGQIRLGDWSMSFSWYHRIISDGTRIYQADGGHTVRALSPDGGRVIWEKSVKDDGYADMVATDGKTLAVVISSTDNFPVSGFRNFNRNANIARMIVGLDPATGRELWRYEGIEGFPLAFLIVDHGVVAAASHLIGPRQARDSATSMRSTHQHVRNSILVSLDARTGREHFRRAGAEGFAELNNVGDRSGLNVGPDRIIYNESMYAYVYGIHSGELLDTIDWGTRFTGWSGTTRRFLLNGMRFVAHDRSVDQERLITHSDYGSYNRPANGTLYIAGGFLTTSSRRTLGEMAALAYEEHFPARLENDQRLLVRGRAEGLRNPAPEDWPTFRGDFARRAWRPADGPAELSLVWQTRVTQPPANPGNIRYGWRLHGDSPGMISQAVADGSRALVTVPDRHELVCLDLADGRERWRTRLGGRSTAPPTLAGDVAFVGVSDGTVSAINLKDGSIIWTFLAAPYERLHNAYQQIESTHPVPSSPVLHDGTLYVAAGRHGLSDNGIFVWALDPATGALRNSTVVTAGHVNDLMQLVDGKLRVAYSVIDPVTMARTGLDRRAAPSLIPDEHGHAGGMGWIGPYMIWRGYRTYGPNGVHRAGAAVQIDDGFVSFTANSFREVPVEDVNNSRRVIRITEDRFSDSISPNSMHTFLAGAGRYFYFATRRGENFRIAVVDREQGQSQVFDFAIAQAREQIIPDSIAIAHGHVILTTTAGRVLAFGRPRNP